MSHLRTVGATETRRPNIPIETIVGDLLDHARQALVRAIDAQHEARSSDLARQLELSVAAVDAVRLAARCSRGVIALAEASAAAREAVMLLERGAQLGILAHAEIERLRKACTRG